MVGDDSTYENDEVQFTRRLISKLYPKIQENTRPLFYYSSNFLLEHFRGNCGGGTTKMNDSDLALWCIDAIKLVRDQMHKKREGDTTMAIPFCDHWPCEGNSSILDCNKNEKDIPVWARVTRDISPDSKSESLDDPTTGMIKPLEATIFDLPALSNEIASLLDSMADMHNQQMYGLRHLRPPTRLARNWYFLVLGLPIASYTFYKILKEQMNSKLLPEIYNKVVAFCEEHIFDPMRSM